MKTQLLITLSAMLLTTGTLSRAAETTVSALDKDIISIACDGINHFAGDVMTADDNVACNFQDCTAMGDHLTYNRLTHTLVVTGHAKLVRHADTIIGTKITVPDCFATNLHFVVAGSHTPVQVR